MSEELGIREKKSDFGKWYIDVMKKCNIVDQRYGVKGFPVYMPWGMFITKQIISMLEKELENTDHKPVNFPVVIPEKNLRKEKEHVKGFEKEVFWITHAGKNELDERLFLRPTSETAMYPMYSVWIRSHKDLPLKLYQTVQVYRYETKMTKPLLRGREFFWIESHTAQKSEEDVEKQIEEDMKISEKIFSEELGIPFLLFQRPEWDKFPGAEYTYAYDTLIPDGRSLQLATTHNLGKKFSKAFSIEFSDENGDKKFACQSCFGPGISRIVAAIISIHGDDKGLILPPYVAPVQVIVIPIPMKGKEKRINEKTKRIAALMRKKGIRTDIDARNYRPGFKFNEWEMKGIPLRMEIGPKDVERKQTVVVRRDTGEKMILKDEEIEKIVPKLLDNMFITMKEKARKEFEAKIHKAKSMDELKKCITQGGFTRVNLCSVKEEKCAEKIEKLGTKVRGTIFGRNEKPDGPCISCSKAAKHVVYIAKAY